MALDDQKPISNQFNKEAALNAITKRVTEVQFTPKEQERYFDIRRNHTEEAQKEKRAFNDPEEYRRRVQDKEKELLAKNPPAPHLDNKPQNMQSGSLWGKVRNEAQKQVRLEHEGKLQQIDDRYLKSMTGLIETAEQRQKAQLPEAELDKLQRRSDEINQNRRDRGHDDEGRER